MLPATEKPSPAVCPHQSTQALPVCAARPAVGTDQVHLAMLAALVGGDEPRDDLRRRQALRQARPAPAPHRAD